MSTREFVTTAAVANKFEIDSSQLALKQSRSRMVRDFARHMVEDHSQAGEDMHDALARARTRVTPPARLDAKHREMMDRLRGLRGSSFDREYIRMQMNAHRDAVHLFSDYAKTGGDRTIRNFAAETLPTLKDHRRHVNRLNDAYNRR
jgi:putative membrane protein